MINNKDAADTKHAGNSSSKPKRKRKRKNKNKNKLPPDQIPVFDAEIAESISAPVTVRQNNPSNNSHVRFDGKEAEEDMEVENGETSLEFTAEEVQRLYAKSVSSKPSPILLKRYAKYGIWSLKCLRVNDRIHKNLGSFLRPNFI